MNEPTQDVMTPEEAAEQLGITVARVGQLFEKGALKGRRIGKGRRSILEISKASVKERLENPVKPGRPSKN